MPDIEVIARGVLVDGGQLLLCHSKGADNTYLPGGHVDFGESAPVSLEREMQEELGVTAKAGRFLGAVEHTFVQKGEEHCEVNLVFTMTCDDLDPSQEPGSMEDYIEFLWCPVETVADSALEPSVLTGLLGAWLENTGAGWATTYP